jgi:hypothetical protein
MGSERSIRFSEQEDFKLRNVRRMETWEKRRYISTLFVGTAAARSIQWLRRHVEDTNEWREESGESLSTCAQPRDLRSEWNVLSGMLPTSQATGVGYHNHEDNHLGHTLVTLIVNTGAPFKRTTCLSHGSWQHSLCCYESKKHFVPNIILTFKKYPKQKF